MLAGEGVRVYVHRDVLADTDASGRISFNFAMHGTCWVTVEFEEQCT